MFNIYRYRWLALLACIGCAGIAFQGAFDPPQINPNMPGGQIVPFGIVSDYRTMATLAGFFFAVFAFFHNAKDKLDQARKQHTLDILFDTRLSSEFRRHLENRKRYFGEGEKVDPALFWEYLRPGIRPLDETSEPFRKRECAEAIRALLNYYEFLALGIAREDLDEDMLKGTIRGIMVRLVRDMYDVIETHRMPNPHNDAVNEKTYEHLIRLYMRWKKDGDPAFANVPAIPAFAAVRRRIAKAVDPSH